MRVHPPLQIVRQKRHPLRPEAHRTMRTHIAHLSTVLGIAATLAACGGKTPATGGESTAATPTPQAAAAAGPQTPDPGGKIVVVELITDETGSYFKPRKLEVHRGDVVRFTLSQGVHNVDFLPDSNPGKTGLPPASDMLQLPGQTFDVKVTFPPGHYYFQCDPHSALGMHGDLEVEKD